MYEGFPVNLQMERVITPEGIFDEGTHHCVVISYEDDDDFIRLRMIDENLQDISLDAKYRCYIETKNEILLCHGMVEERYRSNNGSVLVFKIENGFYVIPEEKKPTRKVEI